MDDTRTFILSLLALAHAESLPAFSFADIRALLPASSHTKNTAREKIASLLVQLEKEGVAISRNGWYALKETPNIEETKRRIEISHQKIARNRFFFFLMQMIPFVKAALITGSVSMENAKKESDIDILCIITTGRIWTARMLLLLLAELFGKRREQKHCSDKICFNCFVTTHAVFPLHNIASAHMLARATPLFGNETIGMFFTENTWMEKYISRPLRAPLFPLSRPLRAISATAAWLLSGSVGGFFERALAQWQISRLRRKIKKGGDASGLVLREDAVTLYYPDIKNKTIMARYADMTKKIDF